MGWLLNTKNSSENHAKHTGIGSSALTFHHIVIQALSSFLLTSCTVSNFALQLGWKLELLSFKNWKIIKVQWQLFGN
jgi:hypothetical protein